MRIVFFTWLFLSLLAIIVIEPQVKGSHYQGMGYLIVAMYSVPLWLIILIIYVIRRITRHD